LTQDEILQIGLLKRRTALGVELNPISGTQDALYVAANRLFWTARITHTLFRT
jgi:hypothetical protein